MTETPHQAKSNEAQPTDPRQQSFSPETELALGAILLPSVICTIIFSSLRYAHSSNWEDAVAIIIMAIVLTLAGIRTMFAIVNMCLKEAKK